MANPHRGEVTLSAGDKTYTLVFTINAVCALEKLLEKGVDEIMMERGKVTNVRAMLWAALLRHHKMEVDDAGDVMDEAGAEATGVAVTKAVALAFPPPGGKGAGKNPR